MSRLESNEVLSAEEREIARRLSGMPAGEPPPELLERLKGDVPEDLAERLGERQGGERRSAPRRRLLAAAAVLVTLVGGGWLAWSVWQVAPPAGEVVGERAERQVERPSADRPELEEHRSDERGLAKPEPEEAVRAEPRAEAEEQVQERVPAGPPPESSPQRRQEAPAERPEAPVQATSESAVPSAERETKATEAAPEADAETAPETATEAASEADAEPPAEPVVSEEEAARAPGSLAGGARARQAPASGVAAFGAPAADSEARLSTTGEDVDAGAFMAVRSALRAGRLPPPEAVRVQGMVNAYRYADPFAGPPPAPGETFRVVAGGAPSPYAPRPRHRLLRFQIATRPEPRTGPPGTVAEAVRARVEFDPRTVARWRLTGSEGWAAGEERDRALDLGRIGAGQTVTVLYEVELADSVESGALHSGGSPSPGRPLALLELRWRDPGEELLREEEIRLRLGDLAPSWEAAPADLRLAATVAELGEILRDSPHAAAVDTVLREARRLAAERPDDAQVAELVELAERTAGLLAERAREDTGP